MAVIPQQILDYISRQEEEDELRARLFPEGMPLTREGITGEGYTAGDIVDVYQDLGTGMLPVDAYEAFSEGDILGGVTESGKYLAEFTPFPALYRTGEALLDRDYGTAALELTGAVPFGGRMFRGAAIRDGDRLNITETSKDREVLNTNPTTLKKGSAAKPLATLQIDPKIAPSSRTRGLPDDYKVEFVDRDLPPAAPLNAEEMNKIKGAILLPTIADKTSTRIVKTINDVPLTSEGVSAYGGFEFPRLFDDMSWANSKGASSSIYSSLNPMRERGDRVFLNPVLMSGTAGDFNKAHAQSALLMMASKDLPSKEGFKAFNDVFGSKVNEVVLKINKKREKLKEKGKDVDQDDLDFLDVAKGLKQLSAKDFQDDSIQDTYKLITESPNLRKAFMESLDADKVAKTGEFPDAPSIRAAYQSPELDSFQQGASGIVMTEIDPELSFEGLFSQNNPLLNHPTYDTQMRRKVGTPVMGQTDTPYPLSIMMRDFVDFQNRIFGTTPDRNYPKGFVTKNAATGGYGTQGGKREKNKLTGEVEGFENTRDSSGILYGGGGKAYQRVDDQLVDDMGRFEEAYPKIVEEAVELFPDDNEAYLNYIFDSVQRFR